MKVTLTLLTAVCLAAAMPVIHAQETTQGTYLGDITFQNQTISRASAEMLHRQMQLSRASELVVWSRAKGQDISVPTMIPTTEP